MGVSKKRVNLLLPDIQNLFPFMQGVSNKKIKILLNLFTVTNHLLSLWMRTPLHQVLNKAKLWLLSQHSKFHWEFHRSLKPQWGKSLSEGRTQSTVRSDSVISGLGKCLRTGSFKHILLLTLLFCKPILEAKIILKGQRNKKYLSPWRVGFLRTHMQTSQVCRWTNRRCPKHTWHTPCMRAAMCPDLSPGVPTTQRNLRPRRKALLTSPNADIPDQFL